MSSSDPFSEFGDDDKTIIRPSPGGRRRQAPVNAPAQGRRPGLSDGDIQEAGLEGSNPLIASSFSLLSLVARLRNLPFHRDINELKRQLIDEIKAFETRALQKGASQQQVNLARYFLCSLIDETVLNTPWGNQSAWAHESLSSLFFKKMWGGEEFFQILDQLKQQPAQNLTLMEFAYFCLSLGFEGKYRHKPDGSYAIENQRLELYLLIQRIKGDSESDLSARWQGLRDLRNPLIHHVPLWVIAVVAGALITIAYMGFGYAINSASDRVCQQWLAIAQEEPKSSPVPLQKPAVLSRAPDQVARFRKLLTNEIALNKVEVVDGPILRIYDAFRSGSDKIRKDFQPMLSKIAHELEVGKNHALVVGHTDNQKIKFSARFPSNWHLSVARAENVAVLLKAYGSLGERIRYEGRADWEPVAPNDTSENRALNRRIDIQIR